MIDSILVVDDEAMIRNLFVKLLGEAFPGVHLYTAADGDQAVREFERRRPRVISMDLRMPTMDGVAAYHAINNVCARSKSPRPGVVFCTGFAPPDSVWELAERDARVRVLTKPVDADVLVAALREAGGEAPPPRPS